MDWGAGALKPKFWMAAAAVAVSLSACADGPPRHVKSPDSVILTQNDITDRPYTIVKDLDVSVGKATLFSDDPTPADIDKKLKKEAAELNADAVIFVRYGTVGVTLFNWGELEGKGRAIVFKK